ncbi:hypothetical protein NGF19_22580 [Streptomyces sp. RY43-2]|uniref:Uncharacterized protein n=1 Tax=Streptomyces macrolidinus TaxID=2952607 RepID=A0ABT0ZIX9_9ACTN|nr:hypothetical protein [Streptomyces macrolidinus]MCN9243539.1 hypothetical protein [Streptomyces macrolidinus]
MTDGFVFWYRQAWRQGAPASLFRSSERAGLGLANPVSGRVTAITNGPGSWGEQVPVTSQQLAQIAESASDSEVDFQWWLDGETDVYVRIRRVHGDAAVIEFGLDGLGARQESVIGSITWVLQQTWSDCLGLVVDRSGATEDTDWDMVVLRGGPGIVRWPDTLAVPQAVAARSAQLAVAAGQVVPPLVVHGQSLVPGRG